MHIDPDEKIAGVPALQVRAFLRRVRERAWGLADVQEVLGISSERAQRFVAELCELDCIEREPSPGGDESWCLTLKGNALAMASAAKPLHRKTAQRIVQELLDRARQVNRDDYYLYRVTKVAVFGSFLTDRERINDIDVAVDLKPKEADPRKFGALLRVRIEEAMRHGRSFGNLAQECSWPYKEVLLFLKSRSRGLSLHTFEDGILKMSQFRVLYEE